MEKRKQGRSRKIKQEVVLTIRLEQTTVEALDALADRIYQSRGIHMSRADIIREALHDRLQKED